MLLPFPLFCGGAAELSIERSFLSGSLPGCPIEISIVSYVCTSREIHSSRQKNRMRNGDIAGKDGGWKGGCTDNNRKMGLLQIVQQPHFCLAGVHSPPFWRLTAPKAANIAPNPHGLQACCKIDPFATRPKKKSDYFPLPLWRISARRIFPLMVLGRSETYSTTRGYL